MCDARPLFRFTAEGYPLCTVGPFVGLSVQDIIKVSDSAAMFCIGLVDPVSGTF
jgi:hypothetical protein